MSVAYRGRMDNCRLKFEKEKSGRVAFLGGSITANPGWRDMVSGYIKERFPDTNFEFINAGIPSLGSTPGSMRLNSDVLSKGTIDLLFVEAAVNDATNGFSPEQQIRGMEGIVYHAIQSNPCINIVMLHFVDQDKMADYNNGRVPEVIQQHEKVAEYYSVSSIDLAREVNNRILNGEFSWRDDFKDLHPSPFGQGIYFRTIKHFFDTLWKDDAEDKCTPVSLPDSTLDKYSYINGNYLPLEKVKPGNGWSYLSSWNPENTVSTREGFVNLPILEATQPGALLKLKFKGKAIGLFVTSGPDAGIVEYSIDGEDFKAVDQFTQWSTQLHLPWIIMLDDELKDGRHTLILRVAEEKNPVSTGNVCRIHKIVVNSR
jgi:lysophospholipase L1-like esterase